MDPVIAVAVATGTIAPADPAILTAADVHIRVEPHPQLTAALEAAGATRRGPLAFSYPASARHRPLLVALTHAGPAIIGHGHARRPATGDPRLSRLGTDRQHAGILEQVGQSPGNRQVADLLADIGPFPRDETTARTAGVIVVHRTRAGTWLRICTHRIGNQRGEGHPPVNLHTHPVGGDPRTVGPVDGLAAVATLKWLRARRPGIPIVDSDGVGWGSGSPRLLAVRAAIADGDTTGELAERFDVDDRTARRWRAAATRVVPQLSATVRHSVAVLRADSRLDMGAVVAGRQLPDDITVPGPGHVGIDALGGIDLTHPNIHVDPDLLDIHRMQTAPPAGCDSLFGYQQQAAGRHLATGRGLLNTSAAGTGKTAMTVGALAVAAERKPADDGPYRALVVCPASVRDQWLAAARRWAPNLPAYAARSGRQADELAERLTDGRPLLAICSYTGLVDPDRPLRQIVDQHTWDDLVADEIVGLARPTKTARALWQLRSQAARAAVLTATPHVGGQDVTGTLLGWARNDRSLDGADPETLGPAIVCAGGNDADAGLPSTSWTVVPIAPAGPAGRAIRQATDTLASAGDGPARSVAQRRLAAASMLARTLADPTGTLDVRLKAVCEAVVDSHGGQTPTVVFTDSSQVAERLASRLADVVDVALLDGGADRDRVAGGWQAGRFDVLVVAPAGQRGVNLQRPGPRQRVVHADMPWDAGRVTQRNGRAVRVGGADHVEIVAVVWAGTVEQQVADAVADGRDPGSWVQLATVAA